MPQLSCPGNSPTPRNVGFPESAKMGQALGSGEIGVGAEVLGRNMQPPSEQLVRFNIAAVSAPPFFSQYMVIVPRLEADQPMTGVHPARPLWRRRRPAAPPCSPGGVRDAGLEGPLA